MKFSKAAYAAAGAIAALAVAIFIHGTGNSGTNTSNTKQIETNSQPVEGPTKLLRPIELSIKDITINQINNRTANVQVAFTAFNPTKGTIIVEEIQYKLVLDGKRVLSGVIGEKLEGFLASSAGVYPVISNSSVILKDKQLVQRDNSTSAIWDKMIKGKATYLVIGTISYKSTSGLESNRSENDFELTSISNNRSFKT